MKIAIMQPYIFPYIGYFQLINAVDLFVFYDDVNFIKQGWINRNRILLNNRSYYFSIPIKNLSPFKKIKETEISAREYIKYLKKFFKSIESSYKKAPFYNSAFQIVENTFTANYNLISELAILSIQNVCNYLKLTREFQISSHQYADSLNEERTDRIIKICQKAGAKTYINPVGAKDLYSKEYFKGNGINLFFLKSNNISYKQFENEFIPWLSIIDVMMFNSPQKIRNMLNEYELI